MIGLRRRPRLAPAVMTVEEAAEELAWVLAEAKAVIEGVPPLCAPDEVHAAFAGRVARFQARKSALVAFLEVGRDVGRSA